MSEGYPDYARLAQQGGTLLYGANGSIPQDTILFQGYVGPWPYINSFTDPVTGAENVTIFYEWYTDETFTVQVGFRLATRTQFSLAATQYANLSPWLRIFYTTASGNPISWTEFGIYGATGVADPNELLSADAPILSGNPSIPASTTMSFFPQHQSPGAAKFNVSTTLTSWFVNIFYLSSSSYVYTLYWQLNQPWAGGGGVWDVPALDTQHRVDVHNGTAAAGTINFGWAYG